MTIREFKTEAINRLSKTSPSASLDVNVLLEHILKCNKTYLLTHSNDELSEDHYQWLKTAVSKRETGFPIAYITGIKEFYGYEFAVTPSVLIPKPDTEILVERAVNIISDLYRENPDKRLSICDMCSGSGCIGLSVLKAFAEKNICKNEFIPKMTMVDISQAALEIAKKNTDALWTFVNGDDITFIQSNLFEKVSETFDLILTNPPYIPSSLVDELLLDGRSEPRLALDGDVTLEGLKSTTDDGLAIIRNLLPQAKEHLFQNGIILMETGEYNAEETKTLSEELGFISVIHKDLEGQLRMVEMKRNF